MKKIIYIIFVTLQIFALPLFAQEETEENKQQELIPQCPNEWNFWVAGGWQPLHYQTSFGNREEKIGGALGFGYGHYFSEHWGFLVGTELSLYRSGFNMNNLHDNYDVKDLDPYHSQDINFRYKANNYKESQQLLNVNIPLLLQYQTFAWDNNRVYTAFGFKLGIPVSQKYESEGAQIISRGYYYDWWQELDDEREYLGFGTFNNQKGSGKTEFGMSYTGTVETGIKWSLGNGKDFYTGLYFDYTFNDILKGKRNKQFVEYRSYEDEQFKNINSVLNSQYTYEQGGETKSFSNKVSPMALGIKLRLGIGVCPKDKAAKEEESRPVEYEEETQDSIPATPPTLQGVEEHVQPEHKTLAPVEEPVEIKKRELEPAPPRRKERTLLERALDEERRRATAEYGKLKDVMVLYIDGYEINQTKLSPRMEMMLNARLDELWKYNNGEYEIICEGHTCDLGREEFNMNLAQMRAEVIRQYMITQGFKAGNIIAVSKGESTPVVPNTNEQNRKINRRVVFLIKEK